MIKNNKEQKEGTKGIWIPGEVAFNKKITETDKFVWWIIDSLDCSKKHCYVSNEYIAKRLGFKNQTISNSIAKLKEHGYIIQVSFNGRKRVLKTNDEYKQKYRHLIEEFNARKKEASSVAAYNEIYRQPINDSDIIKVNKNNENKSIINDRIRFENKSKNIPVKLNNRQDLYSLRLIEFWKGLGHTTQHNTNKPYNKSCLQMIKYLTDLQNGRFAVNRRFDPEWIKKENIPEDWFTRPWLFQELKNGLMEASKYSLEGYWPERNKENFKSLSYILYNDFGKSNRSWLFTAMKKSPQTIRETFQKIPLEKIVKKLMKNPIWPKGYKFDQHKLGRGLVELRTFSDNLIRDNYNKSHQWFGTLDLLLKEYLNWIDENDWIEINQGIIGINNGVFRKFIEFQSKEIGLQIKSKGWK